MGELEGMIMSVLWDNKGWLTPGEVQGLIAGPRPLAYTTVMTILVRLLAKGRVERQRDGRAYAYRAVSSREEEAATRMGQILGHVDDRPTALAHFVDTLNDSDRAQLRRMLKGRQEV